MISQMFSEIERKVALVKRVACDAHPGLKDLIKAHGLLGDIVSECRELDRVMQERYLDIESGQIEYNRDNI